MGLTVACAQCHTHKFDPITQEEYYKLYAIFNQTEDNDSPSEAPRIPTPSKQDADKKAALEAKIADLRAEMSKRPAEFQQRQKEWEKTASAGSNWTVLKPTDLKATSGATLKTDPDGTIHVSGKSAETETYTITLPNSERTSPPCASMPCRTRAGTRIL